MAGRRREELEGISFMRDVIERIDRKSAPESEFNSFVSLPMRRETIECMTSEMDAG